MASGDEVPLGTPPVDRLLGTYHHSRSSRTFRIALLTIVALLTLALLGLNESLCVHSACTRHLPSGMPPAFCQVRHNGKAPEGQHGDDDA